MDFINRSKTELCKAYKQALGLLTAEHLIDLKAVDAKTGVNTVDIRNFRTTPTPEDVERVDAVYPGFKSVFLDYLNGKSRWGEAKTKAIKADVEANAAQLDESAKYWRDKFLETNETLTKTLLEIIKKDV